MMTGQRGQVKAQLRGAENPSVCVVWFGVLGSRAGRGVGSWEETRLVGLSLCPAEDLCHLPLCTRELCPGHGHNLAFLIKDNVPEKEMDRGHTLRHSFHTLDAA